ncbi:hypothetical protein LTS08_006946 [Lithohypha guttulata]|nr:hypothetical protein LTR51_001996 [Lithohypha guttulata]KAK5097532.1 hypothetical protein LTS08_006946 [Lithohypha guttulata]
MAAAIKAVNAKIRSNKVLDYFCSTHFWGPASNFGIPLAAVMDTQKSPEFISPQFTTALCLYSGTFMRYALAVTPRNGLLFACHFVNFNAQLTQMYRWYDYNYQGGKTKWENIKLEAERQGDMAGKEAQGIVNKVEQKGREAVEEVKRKVS